MKYSVTSPYLPYLSDRCRTGNFGEDRYRGGIYCSECGETLGDGESYYDVGGNIFCMRCEKSAESFILDEVRDEYIYEL